VTFSHLISSFTLTRVNTDKIGVGGLSLMRQKIKDFGELSGAILWVIIVGMGTYLIVTDLVINGLAGLLE
jgi:hypothetical protein